MYQEQSALEKTNQIENYYGFEKGISGKDLYKAGIGQAIHIGVEVKSRKLPTYK